MTKNPRAVAKPLSTVPKLNNKDGHGRRSRSIHLINLSKLSRVLRLHNVSVRAQHLTWQNQNIEWRKTEQSKASLAKKCKFEGTRIRKTRLGSKLKSPARNCNGMGAQATTGWMVGRCCHTLSLKAA